MVSDGKHEERIPTIDCKNHGRSVRGFTRRFLKSIVLSSKWAETAVAILAACHSQIFESGQKGGMDEGGQDGGLSRRTCSCAKNNIGYILQELM